MGDARRVFYNGSQVLAVEHRADEYALGADAYTVENVPAKLAGVTWFIQDVGIFDDSQGIIPWDALWVRDSADSPAVAIDMGIRDAIRQKNAK